MIRPARPRGSLVYDKQPLSLEELVDRLMARGLHVPEPDRAARYLRHIGYYRLSPYAIPFRQAGTDHTFRPGTGFDDLLDLYVFDRTLRLLVMDALERVEVAVRAALTDHMSTAHGDSHWYTKARHFRDQSRHAKLMRIIQEPRGTRRSHSSGEEHRAHGAGAGILAGNLRPCTQRLRTPWSTLEPRPRRLPRDSRLPEGLMADRP